MAHGPVGPVLRGFLLVLVVFTTAPDAWDADLAVELTVVGGVIEYARPGAPG